MKIIKTYVADDGTKFDNQYDCMDYEEKLRANAFADSAFLFNKDGEKLPLTSDGFENAYFIICTTEEAAAYMYDEFGGVWENPWQKDGNVVKGAWAYLGDGWTDAYDIIGLSNLIQRLLKKNG